MADRRLGYQMEADRVQNTVSDLVFAQPQELVPATPTDAIGAYAALLLRWDELSQQQAQYEAELRKLQASGDKLKAQWDAFSAERQACLTALEALTTPPNEVIERAWDVFTGHLALLCTPLEGRGAFGYSAPPAITALAHPSPRNPRGAA